MGSKDLSLLLFFQGELGLIVEKVFYIFFKKKRRVAPFL